MVIPPVARTAPFSNPQTEKEYQLSSSGRGSPNFSTTIPNSFWFERTLEFSFPAERFAG
jgi:hypothetical protein